MSPLMNRSTPILSFRQIRPHLYLLPKVLVQRVQVLRLVMSRILLVIDPPRLPLQLE